MREFKEGDRLAGRKVTSEQELVDKVLSACDRLEANMNIIVAEIKTCIELLSKDGSNTKAEVKQRLEKLVEGM